MCLEFGGLWDNLRHEGEMATLATRLPSLNWTMLVFYYSTLTKMSPLFQIDRAAFPTHNVTKYQFFKFFMYFNWI